MRLLRSSCATLKSFRALPRNGIAPFTDELRSRARLPTDPEPRALVNGRCHAPGMPECLANVSQAMRGAGRSGMEELEAGQRRHRCSRETSAGRLQVRGVKSINT